MTDQQQEARWEKTGATTIRVGDRMTIHVPWAKGTYKADCEALLDSIVRDHGQADVAEALRRRLDETERDCIEYSKQAHILKTEAQTLRAENAKLREALEDAGWKFIEIQQTDESKGREYLRDLAGQGYTVAQQAYLALDAAPEGKQE